MSRHAAAAVSTDLFANDSVPARTEPAVEPGGFLDPVAVVSPGYAASAGGGGGDSRAAMLEKQRQLAQEKARQRMTTGFTLGGGGTDGLLLGAPGRTATRGAPMMLGSPQLESGFTGGTGSLLGPGSTSLSLSHSTSGLGSSAATDAGYLGSNRSNTAGSASGGVGAAAYVAFDGQRPAAAADEGAGASVGASLAMADAIRERERRARVDADAVAAGGDASAGGGGGDPGSTGTTTTGSKAYSPISPYDAAVSGRAPTARSTSIMVGGGGAGGGGAADGPLASYGASGAELLDLSDLRRFLTTPTPRSAGVVQCIIERDRSGLSGRMFPTYSLHLADGHRFLLAGRKRSSNKTSNYLVSLDRRDLNRDSECFLGKVRSNYFGTEFIVYDDGVAPDKKPGRDAAAAAAPPLRHELALVTYASNLMGSRGPRKMKVAVPRLAADGRPVTFQPLRDADSMAELLRTGHTGDMVTMVNKQPKWNDTVGAYVLNFSGRVTMASVKNFQLVTADDEDAVLLQFGRVDKDKFTMDYQWPLSPLQAFSITLSSFDYKLACE